MALDLVCGEGNRKVMVISPESPDHEKSRKTIFVVESIYKYLLTHIEVLKLCFSKSGNE